MVIFGAPYPTPVEDMYAHRAFCMKLNSEQISFEEFFDIMCIFGSVEP